MLEIVSTPQEAIAFLRRHHARPGAVEAAFAFDRATGELLEFATGTEESVDLDEEKLAVCDDVLLLHSHPVDAAALQDDWQFFLVRDGLREFVVVGPAATYFLEKPDHWELTDLEKAGARNEWLELMLGLALDWNLTVYSMEIPAEREAVTIEINRRMAARHGLNFWLQRQETTP